jgi:hypothetical protein
MSASARLSALVTQDDVNMAKDVLYEMHAMVERSIGERPEDSEADKRALASVAFLVTRSNEILRAAGLPERQTVPRGVWLPKPLPPKKRPVV